MNTHHVIAGIVSVIAFIAIFSTCAATLSLISFKEAALIHLAAIALAAMVILGAFELSK